MLADKDIYFNEITASYSAQIDSLKVNELVSMMADVFDYDTFSFFLANTADSMSILTRFKIIATLNRHFEKYSTVSGPSDLDKFLEILSRYPVAASDYEAYFEFVRKFSEQANVNVRRFIDWEVSKIKRAQNQVMAERLLLANGHLLHEQYYEAIMEFTKSPRLKMTLDSLNSLIRCNVCSAARYNFVCQALAGGNLNPNMKTADQEHVLFSLARSSRKCNDIVKALLLNPACKLPVTNARGESLRHVAKHNVSLSEKDREILAKLFKSESRSQSALDKILPL
jgi:hypothetical protein